MKNEKIALIIAVVMVLSVMSFPFVFAADTTFSPSDRGYITAAAPESSSQKEPFVLDNYAESGSAAFYKFDFSSLTVPEGKYISEVLLKFTLEKNPDYTDGELVVYGVDNDWSSATLNYLNAPELSEAVGRLEDINLNTAFNSAKRTDVTAYVSEKYYSGESTVSFAVTNECDVSFSITSTSPALEITYSSEASPLQVGKPEFYKNTVASKNYAYNGNMGEKMVLRVPAKAVSASPEKIYVSIASYSKEDILLETSKFEKDIYSSTSSSIISFPFMHTQETEYMKAFVWDENNAPLAEASWFTKESAAKLNSAVASSGEMYPPFSEDVYDYYILYDEVPEALPEISYSYASGMKVSEKTSSSFDTPTIVSVISEDRNKTVTYTFNNRIRKTAVIGADKLEIKGSDSETYSLPLNGENNYVSQNGDDMMLLSFNESVFSSFEIGISGIELDIWAKGNNSKIEITKNGEGNILNEEAVISSSAFKNYKIDLNPTVFEDAASVKLAIKGDIEIFAGSGGIETDGAIRIPTVKLTYFENEALETASVKWSDRYIKNQGTEYPFSPPDKYISQDNPPAFSVPYVEGAVSYDFLVCSDPEMKNIRYSKIGNSVNVFAYPCEFIPGTYYWTARYRTSDGVSEWLEPTRFSVRPDAFSCPVPDSSYVTEKFASMSHPRIIVNEDNLDEFRALKSVSKSSYDEIISTADSVVASPKYGESSATTVSKQIYDTAFAYILTGDTKYSDVGIDILLHVAGWDTDGATAYKVNDQVFRSIVNYCTIGYDWFYNEMTADERKTVAEMLAVRAIYEEKPAAGLNDSPYQIIASPYVSHGWGHMDAILAVAIALAGENETTTAFIDKYLPYKTSFTQYACQDGSYANGHQYSTYYDEDQKILYSLKGVGINLFNRGAIKNMWKYYFYTAFNNAQMEYGDESYGNGADFAIKSLIQRGLFHSRSPYARWKYDSIAIGRTKTAGMYYTAVVPSDVEAKEPLDMPKSVCFRDTGYVAMHSDLINDSERVSLYFRSSQYGSRSHSHPDQNSFHIQAYGQRLAIDSGYYDSYQSVFDCGYTKQAYAHNTITFDGGQGQPIGTTKASGDISNFITTDEFDLTTGEAAEAYNWIVDKNGYAVSEKKLDRFKRHIIYLRPDTYIIIDDIKAKDKDTHSYEWWLNAMYDIEFKENNGARIQVNNARLDADILYPADMKKMVKIDTFSGPDGTVYTPTGDFKYKPVHQRVYFATPSVNQTKIVSLIDVYKGGEAPVKYTCENYEGYMKLIFEDETVCYIRTGDGEYEVNTDGLAFNGDALVKNDKAWMLVDGTSYSENGKTVVSSEKTASLAVCRNNIYISSLNDTEISFAYDKVSLVRDSEGNLIGNDEEGYGISWDYKNGSLTFDSLSGFRSLFITSTDSSVIPVTVH